MQWYCLIKSCWNLSLCSLWTVNDVLHSEVKDSKVFYRFPGRRWKDMKSLTVYSICMKFLTNLSWSKIFTNRTCFSLVMSSSVAINGEAWRKSSLWTLTDTLSLQMNRRSLSLSLFRMKDRLRLMSWKCKILKLMYWKYKILRG